MFKRICSLFFVILLSVVIVTPGFAAESNAVSIPIYTSADGAIGNTSTRGDSILAIFIIRDGTTENCEVYLSWSGTDLYNAWKFTSCTIDNGNLLFNKVYGTISGTTKYVSGAAVGTVKLGDVNIPSDVTKARALISGLQGYNMNSASWLSAAIVGKLGNIN